LVAEASADIHGWRRPGRQDDTFQFHHETCPRRGSGSNC
jgi:hypothetical protein